MKWLCAAHVPKDWEGKTAFRLDGYGRRPYWTKVPVGFSRDPRHCAGIFFCMIELPPLFLGAERRMSADQSSFRSS
jgi:hypothetical protein